ncbi:MAG: zinc ribbon domain-containing protein [Chloroflexi bacterium]|nr:zinc ribbon domain-containing protein [Chloroflexota bacterium]
MPTYEFRCQDCRKKFEKLLTFTEYDHYQAICPLCNSPRTQRVIRNVRFSLGDRSRLANLADPSNLDALDEDPKALGRMMKEMQSEMGANDLPAEFDEVVNRLEKGQTPDEIERDLPELGSSPEPEF